MVLGVGFKGLGSELLKGGYVMLYRGIYRGLLY